MTKKLFSFVWVLLAVIPVFAGPFGLEMGMSLDEVTAVCGQAPEEANGNFYKVIPPKPHPDFDIYVVEISPTYGVHFIKAIGKTITTSVYGDEIKNTFTKLVGSLDKTYGKGTVYDFLRSGSIWDEPNYWMMGLLKQERYLMAYWEKDTGEPFPGNIRNIGLGTKALSTESGYISLEYYSKDNKAAEEEAKKVTDSVF